MKRFIIIIFFLFSTVNSLYVSAQNLTHEFSAYSSIGLSSLRYQLLQGVSSGRFGGDFGVGYTYYLSNKRVAGTGKIAYEQWGISTALGLGWYNASAKLDNGEMVSEGLKDSEGDPFVLTTNISGYEEIQKMVYLNIPVMLQFNSGPLYAMGGIKACIPIRGKYKSTVATLSNEAYYPELANWAKSQTFVGYGSFDDKTYDGKFDLGMNLMLAFEAGVNMSFGKKYVLYCGAYFDYGLNNTGKGDYLKFINYSADNPKNFSVNSVLSSYVDNRKLTTFTDRIKAMAVGIKLRAAFRK